MIRRFDSAQVRVHFRANCHPLETKQPVVSPSLKKENQQEKQGQAAHHYGLQR